MHGLAPQYDICTESTSRTRFPQLHTARRHYHQPLHVQLPVFVIDRSQGKNGGVSYDAGATVVDVIRQLRKLGMAKSGQEGAPMQL